MSGTRRKPGRMGPFIAGLQARWSGAGIFRSRDSEYVERCWRGGPVDAGAECAAGRSVACAARQDFRRYRIAVGCERSRASKSFQPMLAYLREQGVVVERPRSDDPLQRLLDSYRCWLIDERGWLRQRSSATRTWPAGSHAASVGGRHDGQRRRGCGLSVAGSRRVSVGSAKGQSPNSRSLLRFLFVRQLTPRLLTTAIPPVAGWRDTGDSQSPACGMRSSCWIDVTAAILSVFATSRF